MQRNDVFCLDTHKAVAKELQGQEVIEKALNFVEENADGDKLTRSASVCEPRPLVHISMTEYEQKVTRTLYWLTAASQRDALLSSSRGGTRIDWWPEYTL